MSAPFRRLAAWWERRRGKRSRLLDLLGGNDGPEGAGVREPRRPKTPSLSGAAAVDPPHDADGSPG
jgi:hypothetical protein